MERKYLTRAAMDALSNLFTLKHSDAKVWLPCARGTDRNPLPCMSAEVTMWVGNPSTWGASLRVEVGMINATVAVERRGIEVDKACLIAEDCLTGLMHDWGVFAELVREIQSHLIELDDAS